LNDELAPLLSDLTLESTFDSDGANSKAIREFFEPCLTASLNYDRVAGYFSSTVLATAARGIQNFVKNSGKMRILTSRDLTKTDYENFENFFTPDAAKIVLAEFTSDYEEITEQKFRNHLNAVCWMLQRGLLEIRIVLSRREESSFEKFHSKFGVFSDAAGTRVAFSGSVNETTFAWTHNFENFDVFKSWEDSDEKFITPKVELFENLWAIGRHGQWETVELPTLIKEGLVSQFAPDDFPELSPPRFEHGPILAGLRSYQVDALTDWEDAGRMGILQMATGTGKTKTAVAAIKRTQALGSTLTVVVAPYQHICDQWVTELADSNVISTNAAWAQQIQRAQLDVELGHKKNLTIVAVQNTASSSKFTKLIDEARASFENFLFVGDEVHWLGATSFQSALRDSANYRLGLSATPARHFDEPGTDELLTYFGGIVHTLDLRKALTLRQPGGGRVLVDYKYKPVFVDLTDTEELLYDEFTLKINKLKRSLRKKDLTPTDRRELELRKEQFEIQRANVLKLASGKILELASYVDHNPDKLIDCLVYCADNNQLNEAAQVFLERNIEIQKITSETGAKPDKKFGGMSEREFLIDNFAKQNLRVLLAISCLDEGVDIPSARNGIILASSGNVKEFIQRRGRLMRPFGGKEFAEIADFCVKTKADSSASDAIMIREFNRIKIFAEDALNYSEINDMYGSWK